MAARVDKIASIRQDYSVSKPLAPWTYRNPELFALEYQELFLKRWQLVGHVSEVSAAGDFATGRIGRDSVFVIRDKGGVLRAFQNVCRHRASRILSGSGTCKGVIRCPYHGWTYRLDGSLMAVPQNEHFPHLDTSQYGLHEIELEVFHGFLFVRVIPGGPSVVDQFAHTAHYLERFGVADYEPIATPWEEVWETNWKVAWDNYLENYHIPIGHPGLHRLVAENDDWDELTSGVSYGVFVIRDKLSNVPEERRYQELLPHANARLPEELHSKWVQYGLAPNLGIDLYAEMLDIFQLVPLSVDKTLVRAVFYGHKNPTAEEKELRDLNLVIGKQINDEDKVLCERVQQGLSTYGYSPGPLSELEGSVSFFHDMLRQILPVMSAEAEPPQGTLREENARLRNSDG